MMTSSKKSQNRNKFFFLCIAYFHGVKLSTVHRESYRSILLLYSRAEMAKIVGLSDYIKLFEYTRYLGWRVFVM